MDSLAPVALADAGQPRRAPGELSLRVSAETSLRTPPGRAPPPAPGLPPGTLCVTTHRLLRAGAAVMAAGRRRREGRRLVSGVS